MKINEGHADVITLRDGTPKQVSELAKLAEKLQCFLLFG